jgi:DHA1 family tetracycline resistance protein-like MFS transporter
MICTATLLVEQKVPKAQVAGDLPGGKRPGLFDIATYTKYFRVPKLGSLYIQFFLFTFAFSCFMSGFGLFAERRFVTADGHPWTQIQVGYLFTYSGFLGIIIQGGLLGRLVKKVGEVRLVLVSFIAAITAYVTLGFTTTLALLLIVATVSGFGNGVLRPVITSLMTQTVGRHEQGVVLGISGSLSSLAMTVAPISGGALLDHGMTLEWTLIPATAATLGLIAALATRQRYGSASGVPPDKLSSGA